MRHVAEVLDYAHRLIANRFGHVARSMKAFHCEARSDKGCHDCDRVRRPNVRERRAARACAALRCAPLLVLLRRRITPIHHQLILARSVLWRLLVSLAASLAFLMLFVGKVNGPHEGKTVIAAMQMHGVGHVLVAILIRVPLASAL